MASHPWTGAFNQKLHLFGEAVQYKCQAQEGGIGGSGPRFSEGIWLGFDRRTAQNIGYDENQGGIRHARTLMSLLDEQKVDIKRMGNINVTPYSLHQRAEDPPVMLERKGDVAPNPAVPRVPVIRDMCVKLSAGWRLGLEIGALLLTSSALNSLD